MHLKNFQMCFRGKFWQTMNTLPTKIITFVDIGRSRKLDHRGSVKSRRTLMFASKKFSDMFSWEILIDYEHITDQNNHFRRYWILQKIDDRGSVKAQKFNICICKNFRYVFVVNIWQTVNAFPNKIITFVGIGRSQKLDHQGSVNAQNANVWVIWKNLRYVFVRKYFIDYDHITDQNNHFRLYWTFYKN